VGISLKDPRSQKRDLGHPSISPFDAAGYELCRFSPDSLSASPLLGMTNGAQAKDLCFGAAGVRETGIGCGAQLSGDVGQPNHVLGN
jgi:hypothetical protein